jgi:hypothetical protein
MKFNYSRSKWHVHVITTKLDRNKSNQLIIHLKSLQAQS